MSINSPFNNDLNPLPQSISPVRMTVKDKFLKNLIPNSLLAFSTIPAECLAVRRILTFLDNKARLPYLSTIKNLGMRKLFSGSLSRLSYCLTGIFATLQGLEYFGADCKGVFYTAAVKNIILPLSLLANARQGCLSLSKTFHFVAKGSVDPVVHSSFFLRNLLSNSCLLPGFIVRDHCYQIMGKSDSKIPTILGITVSSITSGLMNSFLKPFFTGKYTGAMRLKTAIKLPALIPLIGRETASAILIFANSSPRE